MEAQGDYIQFNSVQSLSCVQLFVNPWTAAHQASLSITNSRSPPKPMSTESVMPWTISSSVVPFSSCLQSLPASGSFQMSQLFTSGGQSIGVSASTSDYIAQSEIKIIITKNIQIWNSPLKLEGEGFCFNKNVFCCARKGMWKSIKTATRKEIMSICEKLRRRWWHPTPVLLLENPMDGGAWWAAVHGIAKSQTWLSDFTLTFPFHALEKEMATHSSVLAWRIPGTAEPGGLPSMGSHRVGHDWSDLAAAAAVKN